MVMPTANRTGRILLGLLAVAALATGCGAPAAAGTAWPAAWPERPVVELAFAMSADLSSAAGTESAVFTPDQQVCELVFRNWANKPTTARTGTATAITSATVDGVAVTPQVETAGAPPDAPGTLVSLPLPGCVPAGTRLQAVFGFTVTLGPEAGEWIGYSPGTGISWLGTAFPLLAWQRGVGWVRDPAVDLYGETVTSEDFRLAELSVTANEDQNVLGTGVLVGTSSPAPGRVTHRFTAEAVRDVSVSVGRFDVVNRQFGDVRVHVATPRSGSRISGPGWADEIGAQLDTLSRLLGPYPYSDLWATIVPPQSDGVEFPTALQFGDIGRSEMPALVAHELAHQWFYSLVGNNQALDPWIDESFATYAEAIAIGEEDQRDPTDIPDRVRGDLGRPMSFWADTGDFERYVTGVYSQGSSVLLAARQRVGASRFDEAMRDYLRTNAHRVATPSDVAAAFDDMPEVIDLLREYGALDRPAS
jgi:Peptidase family M1 domain